MMSFDLLCLQNGVTALYVASQNGHVELVNLLLQMLIYKEGKLRHFHIGQDRTVKLKASQHMTMTSLLDLMFAQKKWTPLTIASQNGHVDIVNVLLQHGASVHLLNVVAVA